MSSFKFHDDAETQAEGRVYICSICNVFNRSLSRNNCIVSNVSSGVSDISIVSNVGNVSHDCKKC